MKRPLLIRSKSIAAMAVSNGLRDAAMAIPVAILSFDVAAAATARGINEGPQT